MRECNLLEDAFDYYSFDGIVNFFKNKQTFKVDKYIRVIAGLLQKLVVNEETLAINKKYLR